MVIPMVSHITRQNGFIMLCQDSSCVVWQVKVCKAAICKFLRFTKTESKYLQMYTMQKLGDATDENGNMKLFYGIVAHIF